MNKKIFFLLLPFLGYGQYNLVNVTNYCGNTNPSRSNRYTHIFEKTENFLVYKFYKDCQASGQDNTFSVWAYDGQNPPYKLKYDNGNEVNDTSNLWAGELVNSNNKIFYTKPQIPNSNNVDTHKELWYFDETISKTLVHQVNTGSFPSGCKTFENLTPFLGGFYYTGDINNTCYIDQNINTTYQFTANRYKNYWNPPFIFSNIEHNGSLFYKTWKDNTTISNTIKKYNPTNNQITSIVSSENDQFGAYPNYLTKFKNKLFFINRTTQYGIEIYYYDDTSNSITCLDVTPGNSSSNPSFLTVYNDNLYFYNIANNKYYIYKYDGINSPTIIHQENITTPGGNYDYTGICGYNGKIYFVRTTSLLGGDQNNFTTELFEYAGSGNAQLVASFPEFRVLPYGPINNTLVNYLPQFNSSGRSSIFSFKNSLYIVGFQKYGSNFTGEDLWKISPNTTLSARDTDTQQRIDVIVYPNPTNDEVSLKFTKSPTTVKVEIYNAASQLMKTIDFNDKDELRFKMPDSKGTYLLRIISDQKSIVTKVTKK
ncbi:T9SS type A sorting domain-containing protein [Chryseobacterium sp. c4a]|uniref:T9SS type A sorting domain-containing protein n=1 Tax=Chryseobacterium sp. c4a TaxID=1573582 RepID=UPI001359048D|nr:T9SS type A sorting domain-containing protein [Chryseobacterium sp. c4a]